MRVIYEITQTGNPGFSTDWRFDPREVDSAIERALKLDAALELIEGDVVKFRLYPVTDFNFQPIRW